MTSLAIETWINQFVLYTICGATYISKGEDVNEVWVYLVRLAGTERLISLPRYQNESWKRDGIRNMDELPWTDDLRWLRTTLRRLIEGEVKPNEFTRAWLRSRKGDRKTLSKVDKEGTSFRTS
jgi:hypothetical protein